MLYTKALRTALLEEHYLPALAIHIFQTEFLTCDIDIKLLLYASVTDFSYCLYCAKTRIILKMQNAEFEKKQTKIKSSLPSTVCMQW